jgi:hypothetical protein
VRRPGVAVSAENRACIEAETVCQPFDKNPSPQ